MLKSFSLHLVPGWSISQLLTGYMPTDRPGTILPKR
jgi:hypothetical protein